MGLQFAVRFNWAPVRSVVPWRERKPSVLAVTDQRHPASDV